MFINKKMTLFNTKRLFSHHSLSYSHFLCYKIFQSSHPLENLPITRIKHYFEVYLTKKRQSWIYRSLFVLFGLFFLGIGCFLFCKTTNFACELYFGNGHLIKSFMMSSCGIFSFLSTTVAYLIKPEKEALNFLISYLKNDFKHLQGDEHWLSPTQIFELISAPFQTSCFPLSRTL